ncbi:MAG: DUF58 domain-containing protein [Candidatus Brocadiia bacterium]
MTESQKYLSPEVLSSISGLEYKARLIVEGFLTGPHRSPYRGFSVEFAQHREYVAGDDLRHLDWKVWGRTDRLYIKQYDAETNFECLLLVDASGSMAFGSGAMTKLEYAKHVAAAMAYLILQQRDGVGLRIFGGYEASVNPSSSPARLRELLHHLEIANGSGPAKLGTALAGLAEWGGRRKVAVVISDFLDDEAEILRGLRTLHRRHFDTLLVHLTDPQEAEFPFTDYTDFRGMEGEGGVKVEPGMLRVAYLEELERHTSAVRNAAREMNMDYLPLVTDRNLGEVLSAYLQTRTSKS